LCNTHAKKNNNNNKYKYGGQFLLNQRILPQTNRKFVSVNQLQRYII